MTPIEILNTMREALCNSKEITEIALDACYYIYKDYDEREILRLPISVQEAWVTGEGWAKTKEGK